MAHKDMNCTSKDTCSTNQNLTCCTPVEERVFGYKKDMVFAVFSGSLLLLAYLIQKLTNLSAIYFLVPYAISYFFGGYYTSIHAYENLKEGKFDIDFLMIVAALGAASLGSYAEGGLLLFLFSIGHALEHYAMDRATNSINSLSELTPKTALLKKGNATVEIRIESLNIGDTIVVRPNSKIAADGVVVKGNSPVNQAPITGESVPVDKEASTLKDIKDFASIPEKHKAYAGTINGNAALEIQVLRLAKDSTLSKLVHLVQEAESEQAPAQEFANKFSRIFVPIILILVVLLLFAFLVIDEPFKASFYRAMAVLVAASPCALAISTPSAVLAGIARAARAGILVKGGLPLSQMAQVDAIAFDKTGTLTTGTPSLTHIYPFGSHSEIELLQIAVAVEALSDHPLAIAIVNDGQKKLGDHPIPESKDLKALIARGVSAVVENKAAYIGNRRLMREITDAEVPQEIQNKLEEYESQGHTAMIVHYDGAYIGIIAVQDVARPEAAESIKQLREKTGIKEILMLTGDNQLVANAIAKDLNIKTVAGDLLPENKVDYIKKYKENYTIAMVGDGVNDAPAMAHAQVGISMGAASSDVALETSKVALLGDSIKQLPFAFALAKQVDKIVKQNLFISIGVMLILVPLTIGGLSIGPAVIIHEGSTLLVVGNALRLLRFKE